MSDNIALIRYKTHGVRLEVPVWRDKFLAWKQTNIESTTGGPAAGPQGKSSSSKPKRGGKKGKKKHAESSDDDDDTHADDSAVLLSDEVAAGVKKCLFEGRPRIFSNAHKRETFQNREVLLKAFGTVEVLPIAFVIMTRGAVVETYTDRIHKRHEREYFHNWLCSHTVRMLLNKYTGESPDELPASGQKHPSAGAEAEAKKRKDITDCVERISPILSIPPKSVVVDAIDTSECVSRELASALSSVVRIENAEKLVRGLWLTAAYIVQQLCDESDGDFVRKPALLNFVVIDSGDDVDLTVEERKQKMQVKINLALCELEGLVFPVPAATSNALPDASTNARALIETETEKGLRFELLVDETFATAHDGSLVRLFLANAFGPKENVSFRVQSLSDMVENAQTISFFTTRQFQIIDRIVSDSQQQHGRAAIPAPHHAASAADDDEKIEQNKKKKEHKPVDKRSSEYLGTLSLNQLKDLCKSKKVGQGGKKTDLIARVLAVYADEDS